MRLILSSVILLILSSCVFATWQETLESEFDIVDTFDNLQDWSAPGGSGILTSPENLPKMLNGSESIWGGYSADDEENKGDFIGSRSVEYTWETGPKNLCMNQGTLYCDMNDSLLTGYGASKLVTYFGNGTPESGYRELHLFFMVKFNPDFFVKQPPPNEDKYAYGVTTKVWEINSGFTGITYWGNETACISSVQTDYGANFHLNNFNRFNDYEVGFKVSTSIAEDKRFEDPPQECVTYSKIREAVPRPELLMTPIYESSEWFGFEYHVKLGSEQADDGYESIKIYYENGTLHSEMLLEDVITNGDRPDYSYNKVTLGGNFQCNPNTVQGRIIDTRYYIDDFIIDGSEIAQSYFSLLSSMTHYNDADADEDGSVTTDELDSYFRLWFDGSVSISSVMQAIEIWKG